MGKMTAHRAFKNFLIFNWRIIALQHCVGLCYTSSCISQSCTYVPSLLNLPPTSTPSHSSRLSQSPRLSSLSHTANSHGLSILHMVACIFQYYFLHSFHPLLPSSVSTSLFSMSESPLLPCKQVHWHLSRFHIYALIYVICFSLPDFLCMMGSRFIHLIRNDSEGIHFYGWVIFHCICSTASLSIHLSVVIYVVSMSQLL